MNKTGFLNELKEKTGYSEEKCLQILDVVDDIFIFGKKNKDKMIKEFEERLNINEEEADEIYNTVMSIIKTSLKEKIKHPFKGND